MSPTPGPWTMEARNNCWAVRPLDKGEDLVYVFRPRTYNGEPCGSATARGRSQEEMEANARLISAAPELLAAAKSLLALMDDVPPDPMPGLSYDQNDRCFARYEFDDLRAAIEKALSGDER